MNQFGQVNKTEGPASIQCQLITAHLLACHHMVISSSELSVITTCHNQRSVFTDLNHAIYTLYYTINEN